MRVSDWCCVTVALHIDSQRCVWLTLGAAGTAAIGDVNGDGRTDVLASTSLFARNSVVKRSWVVVGAKRRHTINLRRPARAAMLLRTHRRASLWEMPRSAHMSIHRPPSARDGGQMRGRRSWRASPSRPALRAALVGCWRWRSW